MDRRVQALELVPANTRYLRLNEHRHRPAAPIDATTQAALTEKIQGQPRWEQGQSIQYLIFQLDTFEEVGSVSTIPYLSSTTVIIIPPSLYNNGYRAYQFSSQLPVRRTQCRLSSANGDPICHVYQLHKVNVQPTHIRTNQCPHNSALN